MPNPTQTLKSDLLILKNLTENNSLSGLRAAKEYAVLALMAWNGRLQQLRMSEQLLVQSIRRDAYLSEIETKYKADYFKKIEPVQAFGYTNSGTPDPHEDIVYTADKLMGMTGIGQLIREQERIRHNINYAQSRISELSDQLRIINEKLAEKERVKESDLANDAISKRIAAEIFMLRELCVMYRNYSRNSAGEEAYTENPKVSELLERLHYRFVAFAERNSWVISGKLVLDFQNPGSDSNLRALEQLIEKIRYTGRNQGAFRRLYRDVEKYAREMERHINDPVVSKNISRKIERRDKPALFDSQAEKTKTLADFWDLTRDAANWWSTHALKKQIDAVERGFRKFIQALHGDTPFCSSPSKTSEEEVRERIQEVKDKNEAEASSTFQTRFEIAESVLTDPLQKKLNSLLGLNDALDTFIKSQPNKLFGVVTNIHGNLYGVGIAMGEHDMTELYAVQNELSGNPSEVLISKAAELNEKFKEFLELIHNQALERAKLALNNPSRYTIYYTGEKMEETKEKFSLIACEVIKAG